ncbi:hypothetical protein Q7C18_02795 [Nesterenkonia sp. CL21]|uniref:VG15 protein n=1 Tax=Nesterenkonia sp. CL21 TaxID=3064894 RepID=UPI0028792DAF|nr:hypothetical protein [Nesterenkonia sp. CL21]MDS2171617.1 hypothetical protein [Nesterenkonia sp. CL21]
MEFQEAFRAYRAAQARLNNAAAYLTLRWWVARVAPLRPGAQPALAQDLAVVTAAARRMARRLAIAYYQYARALDSGRQFGPVDGREEHNDTLNGLRQNFLDRLNDAALLGEDESDDMDENVKRFERELRDSGYLEEGRNERSDALDREVVDRAIQRFLDEWGEDNRLQRDNMRWRGDSNFDDIRRRVEQMLRETAEEESRERRRKLGDDSSDEKLEREHRTVGQKLAGEVHGLSADSARKITEWAASFDDYVMAVARGTSMTPCGFCAMLASRGFTYRSVASAMGGLTRDGGFRKVHPNCNCYPIIRWKNVSDEVDLPEENQEFLRIWKEVRNEREFRRRIRERNRELIEQAERSQEE